RPSAFEYPHDIIHDEFTEARLTGSITHEATAPDPVRMKVYRRNFIPRRQSQYSIAVCSDDHRGSNDDPTGSTLDKGRECRPDVATTASVRKDELCPERARRCNYITRHLIGGRDRGIRQIAENCCAGNHLVQQIELLAQDLGGDQG